MLAPAEKSARSTPRKESFPRGLTSTCSPRNVTFLPSDRSEARGTRSETGKRRDSRTLIISWPTAPVAPTTATRSLLISMLLPSPLLEDDQIGCQGHPHEEESQDDHSQQFGERSS